MGWIIAAAVLAALLLVYVFLLMPRLAGRPDMTPLRAVQYAHRGQIGRASCRERV